MQCPECQFENLKGSKFCGGCGQKFDLTCSECGANNPAGNKFCNECGSDLKPVKEVSDQITETISPPVSPSKETIDTDTPSTTGERKHVTVLFSDLTGYTAMSEKLDPEEVKEITSRIFGEVSKTVAKYDGFIEKYAGDAVMAIFGVPQAHEDDPIRAVKAAREIHQLVDSISPEVEKRIGQPISMHTGINTGLVVTGEVDMERGTHGIAGDTINLASRLSNLAKPGEILVNVDTCRQVEGHFECEYIETTTVKGKADSVEVHQVISQRDKPITIHRLSGLRADLVGRDVEMAELSEAVDNLRQGTGRIFSICGAAGTGKSRLVEEFKAGLDLEQIQWIEGHAYAYSQDMPYFPLVDLLNRLLHIEENDPFEKVREKVESGLQSFVGNQKDIIPYVGGLYSLSYPETNDVSPEFWKSHLQDATLAILEALAKRAPTVFFLEDLHWADPSFVELLRRACLEIRQPAIVLCAYRPTFSLFTGHQVSNIGNNYHDIQLQNLSLSIAQHMLASLLKTETIPPDLKRWVQSKAEGNPFYLEELVNSLIESDTLARDNGSWKLTRSLAESDIPSSLHGLITGRLDRLDPQTKRILQKASVIGRAFLYEILIRISELEERIDVELSHLERLDLIRARSLQPDIEYMFKHALTQEIVYSGLLKKQRREIHENIARVIESVFKDRLAEFNETLAYHFARGQSAAKAVDYLVKSGEKNLARYALEEAHQYFKEAYEALSDKPESSKQDEGQLVDLLIKWAYVFYYRGDFNGLITLFSTNEDIADSLDDKARQGMFNGWLGFGHYMAGEVSISNRYLRNALELGEEVEDQHVIAYACTWLSWCCTDLGLMEEAISFGERANEIAKVIKNDHYLYFKSLAAVAYVYWAKGKWKEAIKIGETIINYGQKHSNVRSICLGHVAVGQGHAAVGDLSSAADAFQKAIYVAADPVYELWAKCWLWQTQLYSGEFKEATDTIQEIVKFSKSFGYEAIGMLAQAGLGLITVMNGQMGKGVGMLEDAKSLSIKNERIGMRLIVEHLLGKVYLQLVENKDPVNLSVIAKNVGFLVKSVPFAHKKAEAHLKKAIEIAKEKETVVFLAQAYLDLGLLHKAKKRTDKAKQCISEAIKIFEQCEAEILLKQAKEVFASLA
ncbi:adenylate/guanylate cyclase domain-containing protein [Thermodesulfobacteriota bacterium]